MQSTMMIVPEVEMADIEATDFTMIKAKLQDNEEGPGWALDLCASVEQQYKRFLALKRAYPDKDIVPDKLVDVFWHQHILDTEKYSLDCNRLFGCFLHPSSVRLFWRPVATNVAVTGTCGLRWVSTI